MDKLNTCDKFMWHYNRKYGQDGCLCKQNGNLNKQSSNSKILKYKIQTPPKL